MRKGVCEKKTNDEAWLQIDVHVGVQLFVPAYSAHQPQAAKIQPIEDPGESDLRYLGLTLVGSVGGPTQVSPNPPYLGSSTTFLISMQDFYPRDRGRI